MSGRGLPYCRGASKRALDLALAIPALVALSPILAAVALLVLVTMGRPVLFRQERAGRDGRLFRLMKFRSMRPAAGEAPQITGRGDVRITPVGRVLRATKLDELPQLFNVVAGDMSLVGPRPEVPRYTGTYTAGQRRVLEVRPGLTDPASLEFRDEEVLLGSVAPEGREAFYVETILPRKLEMNLAYIASATLPGDLALMFRTLGAVILRRHQ
jgi:lipopolysaccharide/colanic/teichoic acid biosynthesis glycosyltransferase